MSIYDGTNGPLIKVYVDSSGLSATAFILGLSTLSSTSATVTAGSGNGTTITFTASNSFTVGSTVTVTGLGIASGSSLNGTYIIATQSSTQFTVSAPGKLGSSTGTGTAKQGDVLTSAPTYGNLVQIPTTDVRSIAIRRGRTREDQSFQPGVATVVLDNWSGAYDPQMLNSTYSIAPYSFFSANRPMRITATMSGTEYSIFSGYIEQIEIDQTLNPTITLTLVDMLKNIANVSVSGTFGNIGFTI